MGMSQKIESVTGKERESRDKKTQYMKDNFAQLKVYLEKGIAEEFDTYCKAHNFKKGDVIHKLIDAELKSAKRSKDVGRIGKMILAERQGGTGATAEGD